LPCWLEEFLL